MSDSSELRKSFVVAAALCGLALPAFAEDARPAPSNNGPTMLSSAFSPESLEKARLKEFESLLDEASLTEDFVGLAVAVVRRGELAMLKTYGVTEAGGSSPVTPNTVFRVGSLSKGFASTLAGLAIEEGKVSLDTPVAPYAKRFALKGGAERKVTVEDVLSHRVGLPPNAYDNLLEDGRDVADILPRFRTVAPICAVGTCYAYQNIAYDLIGGVLSAVYGEPYSDLVRERIFTPLGMRTASVGAAGLKASGDWARPSVRDKIDDGSGGKSFGPWRAVDVKDAYYRTPAAGGVNASIVDMARWLAAQMGAAPDVLPSHVLDTIHTPHVETPTELRRWQALSSRLNEARYALGWRVYDYAGSTLINHSGTVEGYGAQIAWIPESEIGIVILANTRAERVWRILPAFLDIELGLETRDWLALRETPKSFSESFGDGSN